jgi:hypothetical protein
MIFVLLFSPSSLCMKKIPAAACHINMNDDTVGAGLSAGKKNTWKYCSCYYTHCSVVCS